MEDLRKKSFLLTGYLEYLLDYYLGQKSPHRRTEAFVEIVTPRDPNQRGCQLSLKFSVNIHQVFVELEKRGIVVSFNNFLFIHALHMSKLSYLVF